MKDIMNFGIEEARRTMNENKGGPFGAVITDSEGNIISVASNRVLELHDATAHAEVMAIREAGKILGTHDLSGCTLYATGYPCPMCLSAIIWANIKKVYYGTNLKDAEDIGFRDDFIYRYLENKDANTLELLELDHDECLELFNEYKTKNKEYRRGGRSRGGKYACCLPHDRVFGTQNRQKGRAKALRYHERRSGTHKGNGRLRLLYG